jgi:beta-catenin-like protein 1
VDIVIDVVELINELTDEDAGNEDEETVEETEGAMKILVDGLLELSIFELLVDNLPRLNEQEEADKQGIFHVLGIFENILSFNPELATQVVAKTKILSWLLNRIQSKEYDENKGYAAELLSILLQNDTPNRVELGKQDGVESILKVLSQFRRRDPITADETEFMENVFDTLCSALSEAPIKKLFLEAEGPDLMVLMMKDKMQPKSRAIKALDYAMSGVASTAICEAFVEALGLKALFSVFMGKAKKQKVTAALPPSEDIAHILGIMSSLLTNLASDSAARVRLLTKFVENDYEKVERLLEIRDNACTRLKAIDSAIDAEKKEMPTEEEIILEENAWYLRRLDGGLFTLQSVDYILAWLIMEDDGIHGHALKMLGRKNHSLADIVKTLRIYHDNINDVSAGNAADLQDSAPPLPEILQNLINALDMTNTQ